MLILKIENILLNIINYILKLLNNDINQSFCFINLYYNGLLNIDYFSKHIVF